LLILLYYRGQDNLLILLYYRGQDNLYNFIILSWSR
jgi:hypothetical protein